MHRVVIYDKLSDQSITCYKIWSSQNIHAKILTAHVIMQLYQHDAIIDILRCLYPWAGICSKSTMAYSVSLDIIC